MCLLMHTNQTHPIREQLDALYASLHARVSDNESGLNGLSQPERHYYSVRVMLGQVYNGGFEQFLSQHSASLLHDALAGLGALKAIRVRKTLLTAARLVDPDFQESSETTTERPHSDVFSEATDPLDEQSTLDALDKLDDQIDFEEMYRRLVEYVNDCGLLTPAIASAN